MNALHQRKSFSHNNANYSSVMIHRRFSRGGHGTALDLRKCIASFTVCVLKTSETLFKSFTLHQMPFMVNLINMNACTDNNNNINKVMSEFEKSNFPFHSSIPHCSHSLNHSHTSQNAQAHTYTRFRFFFSLCAGKVAAARIAAISRIAYNSQPLL